MKNYNNRQFIIIYRYLMQLRNWDCSYLYIQTITFSFRKHKYVSTAKPVIEKRLRVDSMGIGHSTVYSVYYVNSG